MAQLKTSLINLNIYAVGNYSFGYLKVVRWMEKDNLEHFAYRICERRALEGRFFELSVLKKS